MCDPPLRGDGHLFCEPPREPIEYEECRVDPDCPALMSCLDGECVDPCRKNNPCQGGTKFNRTKFSLKSCLRFQIPFYSLSHI